MADVVPILVDESELPDIERAIKKMVRQMRGPGVHDTDGSVSFSRQTGIRPGGSGQLLHMWTGTITSPPSGEDAYTDNRYWVELLTEIAMPAQRGKEAHVVTNALAESRTTPRGNNNPRVTATNLFEPGNSAGQTLSQGILIMLWQGMSRGQSAIKQKNWAFGYYPKPSS